jgi:hypothetical protein
MIIQFKSTSGEVVNTNFVTPQLMATVGPFTKLITYPTYNAPGDYSYTGPYYGNTPPGVNQNTTPLGRTEPVEGQLTTSYLDEDVLTPFGPTGSYLFPLGQGGSYIGFYSPTGVLYTKFKMEDAAAAAAGITTIATALGAGDAYLLLDVDGSNITPP